MIPSDSIPHSQYLDAKKVGVKSLLAKLMASESLSVIQDDSASTAMFDAKARVLILPKWKGMTDEIYSLLVGHEVGHALFTPKDVLLKDLCRGKPSFFHDIIQIAEDARIEKKIKRKFPGINKDFREGYKQMATPEIGIMPIPPMEDYLGEDGEPIPGTFLDRLLIHTKAAPYLGLRVPFSTEELPLVYATEETETFDQVLEISMDIMEYLKPHAVKVSSTIHKSGESTEEKHAGTTSSEEAKSEKKSEENSENSEDADLPSSLQSKIKKVMDEKLSSMTEAPPQESKPSDEFQQSSGGDNQKDPWVSNSQVTFDVTDVSAVPYIISYQDLTMHFLKHVYNPLSPTNRAYLDKVFIEFTARTKKIVNHMVTEFNLKKEAKTQRKVGIAKRGTLDTNKLHRYKYSEELFRTYSEINKGQSHGLLLFLDMSGSMSRCFYSSVLQILNLVYFCKGARIPFEVFGFADSGPANSVLQASEDSFSEYRRFQSGMRVKDCLLLVNLLSSKQSQSESYLAMKNLLLLGTLLDDNHRNYIVGNHVYLPRFYSLGGTPLDPCILLTKDIFWKFKKANNLDIVHCAYVTDGCSDIGILSGAPRSVYDVLVRNGPFSYQYKYGSGGYTKGKRNLAPLGAVSMSPTGTMLELLRDETNCRSILFFLCRDSREMGYSREYTMLDTHGRNQAITNFDVNGYAEIRSHYDRAFLINPSLLRLDNSQDIDSFMKARPLDRKSTRLNSSH